MIEEFKFWIAKGIVDAVIGSGAFALILIIYHWIDRRDSR